jgi:hypothetical protein
MVRLPTLAPVCLRSRPFAPNVTRLLLFSPNNRNRVTFDEPESLT